MIGKFPHFRAIKLEDYKTRGTIVSKNWTEAELARLQSLGNETERMAAFPGVSRKEIREAAKRPLSGKISKIVELLDKSGIPIEEIGRVDKVRVGTYQMLTKDNEGEAQIHDLEVASLVLSPEWANNGPDWPVVQQADPITLPPVTGKPQDGTFKTAVFLSDPHIWPMVVDGEVIWCQDDRALSIALQVIKEVQPDVIVNGGDLLDFTEWSGKFVQGPEFAHTTQLAINRAHEFLCQQKMAAPGAKVVLMEGNHERRLPTAIMHNAMQALRIKRPGDNWPALSVPHLLRLDELEVDYLSGYPAVIYYLSDNLAIVHGSKAKGAKSTAAYVLDDERVSQIFGHIHRIELAMKTRRVRGGGRTILAQSFGCLCHIDGRVPSTKGAYDITGRPIVSYENWQQGFGVISYIPGEGPFSTEYVYINDGMTTFRGKNYYAE